MTDPGDETASISIVIPAHNEEAVVGRCVERLMEGSGPGELDIIVVANACTDRTAEVAERSGARVLVTPVPGKAHAVRLGDAACHTFPRIYVDADIELDHSSMRAMVEAFTRPDTLACAPTARFDMSGATPFTRRVHQVHQHLMAPYRGLSGAGAYALNRVGHDRAFPLPDVIADDGWVHNTFDATERVVVTKATSVVRPARTTLSELRRRVRVRQGNSQLRAMGSIPDGGSPSLRVLVKEVRNRNVVPVDALCYLLVVATDRLWSGCRTITGRAPGWAVDTTSRTSGE